MSACLAAMTVRGDLMGVTSLVRALGLKEACYERMLALFHSTALDLDALTRLWVVVIHKIQPGALKINGRLVIVGDGIKVAKAGKKMPAVKRLRQESEANTNPSYIMGHSCQAVAMLAGALGTIFAVPLAARIHEGVKFNNNDKRALLDKMALLLNSLGLTAPFYFVADAYYATGKIVRGLLKKGNHLVSRVRKNAVAYEQPPKIEGAKPRGRPRKYGEKIKLRSLFEELGSMQEAPSPVYGEKNVMLSFLSRDLLWRPVGILIRFVAVIHPTRGMILLMSTDLNLAPIEIIRIYSLRFSMPLSGPIRARHVGCNLHLSRIPAPYRKTAPVFSRG